MTANSEILNDYLSRKIKFMNTIAMVFVVFIHSYNYTDTFLQPNTRITEGLHFGAMTQFFFSNAFFRSAVPLYFIISGFLFFVKRNLTPQVYVSQIKKRIKSVLLVFLTVSAFSFVICAAIYSAVGSGVFPVIDERMEVVEQGFLGFLKIALNNPFAFQLWFLMQLFLICLLSPVIYWFINRFGALFLAFLMVLWSFDKGYGLGSFWIFNADTYMFFSFGAYLGIKKVRLPGMNEPCEKSSSAWLIIAALAGFSAIYTHLCATVSESCNEQMILYKLVSVLGIAAMWYLYDIVPKNFESLGLWKALQNYSFMVFLLHEPMMHMLYNIGLSISSSDFMHMLLYFGLPILMTVFMCFVAAAMQKYCSPVYKLLTGNR